LSLGAAAEPPRLMTGGRLWPRSDGEAEGNGATQLVCAPMEQRVILVTLGVSDLARARAFYEALGWTTRAEPDDDVVFFRAEGLLLALWDRAKLADDSAVTDEGGWGGVTLAHNVGSPDEVDTIMDEAASAGATI